MHKLSSEMTWVTKRLFPTLWFGIVGAVLLVIGVGVAKQRIPAAALVVPVAIALFGYGMFHWLIFCLVDEVTLAGKDLIVRNRGDEERIPLANVTDVKASLFINPERIVLTLRDPCRFGDRIAFLPPARWKLGISEHPLGDELRQMVEQARSV